MTQRLPSQERKAQLLDVMQAIFAEATTQRDFTATHIARQAGVSAVLLYRLVGPEYQAMKQQLPGPVQVPATELQCLRQEVTQLRDDRRQVDRHQRTQAVEDYKEAVRLIEHLEQENLALRGEVQLLQQRLREGGQVYLLSAHAAAPSEE